MLDSPSHISRQVRSEIARIRFFFKEGLRLVSNKEIITIPSNANLASFRNIKEINEGSEANIYELVTKLSCMLVGVVRVQYFTPV